MEIAPFFQIRILDCYFVSCRSFHLPFTKFIFYAGIGSPGLVGRGAVIFKAGYRGGRIFGGEPNL